MKNKSRFRNAIARRIKTLRAVIHKSYDKSAPEIRRAIHELSATAKALAH